ncbi:MAG: helix-turn-helix domain-containing protein [Pseudomonadota bacterium]
MIENYIGPRRDVPLHTVAQPDAALQDTAQNNALQVHAVASNKVQPQADPPAEEFTISVDQVRAHFRAKGLQKSKDTIQRWCRTGELACQKRGVLNRYFTTEASLSALEEKLLPDMIAERSGEDQMDYANVQGDAPVPKPAHKRMPVHADENEPARSGVQQNVDLDVQAHAAASNSKEAKTEASPNAPQLTALVNELRLQLEGKQNEIEFLREEVRASRDQRGAVVQISNRMLETLETIAIGGRLERSSKTAQNSTDIATEPVRYSQQEGGESAV